MKLVAVFGDQLLIGFGNANEFYVLVRFERVKETECVIVHQADDRDADGNIGFHRGLRLQTRIWKTDGEREQNGGKQEKFSGHGKPRGF
jgi:hypothetical protein